MEKYVGGLSFTAGSCKGLGGIVQHIAMLHKLPYQKSHVSHTNLHIVCLSLIVHNMIDTITIA